MAEALYWLSLWIFKKRRLCYRKWLMLFSLKLQRDNRQNALAVDPAKRKTGEKGCIFHRTVKMNQPHTIKSQKESINHFL